MSQLKVTLFIGEEIIGRVRNAAYWRKEPLAHIVNRALEKEAKAMEHSNGGKYKPRARALKAGRPKTTAA